MRRIIIFTYFIFLFCLNSAYSQVMQVTLSYSNHNCILGSASVVIENGTSPYQIVWSNGQTTNTINNLDIGNYSVHITDFTLKDTIINFTIQEGVCDPVPSNHFTPNGDLYNDTWNINNIQYFPNFELHVYNRWGQEIHTQSATYKPWDGTGLNINLPDATYFYILYPDKNNKSKFIKGDVSILR